MKKEFRFLAHVLVSGCALVSTARAELVRNPTAVGASFDVGQIMGGDVVQQGNITNVDRQLLSRTGVYVTESGTYNDRLSIHLTVGGLFWYPLPEGSSFVTRLIHFGPGVGQAQGEYTFGDVKDPAAKLQFGLFPMKYNPDAKDLGEYLYRSGTYPGYLWTGGWSFLDAAVYLAQGVRLNVPTFGGKVVHDVTLFMERDIEPNGDISPGYMLTLKPTSFFELGGGVVWAHGIQLRRDEIISPKSPGNAYDSRSGKPLTDQDQVDTSASCAATPSTCVGIPNSALQYYTFKGFKTMARTSLDFGTLFGMDPGQFKLYAEWALLGVKDYPYYYDKKSERMPMMAGLDIPTFGLLNTLSAEVEYHKSRFPNNLANPLQNQFPLPTQSYAGDPNRFSPDSAEYTKDDIHWAIYGRRKVTDGISVVGQVASDHMRPFDLTASPSEIPATMRPSQWYYVLRLEVGI